ncbi:winged helix-turn-helix domain-containing protein, partial [Lysinibacillus sp. D4B1_S16]|uniref:winged helix-turn-helix domain-containing protein n=1 Tax=Lysinibacillus sp. D4B1_S16 TaxID=2941231 RepID=UPI0037C62B23
LRRHQKNDDVLDLQHLKMYTKDMRIINTLTEEEILLTGKQFYLLQYFIRHLTQILTKEQLYGMGWGESY